MRLHVHHIRAARLCTKGARQWFATRGLDWNQFLAEGLDADFVRGLNDPISNQVLAAAEQESN